MLLNVPCREMLVIVLLLILIFLYIKKIFKIYEVIIIISFTILGIILTDKALTPTRFYSQIGQTVTVEGVVEKIEKKNDYYKVFIRGRESVLITTNNDNCIVGDRIAVNCNLKGFALPRNHGEFDQNWYYKCKNIWVRGSGDIVVKERANIYFRVLDKIKRQFLDNIDEIATEDTRGLLKSILMGEKSELDEEVSNEFQENGISHILAISGLHLSIIGLTLYKLLRKSGLKFLPCAIVAGFVLISYGIMTGNSISTLRALIMFIISINAQVTGRRYDIITSSSMAALLLLLQYPLYITASGFLLSFGAVAGIVAITRTLNNITPEKGNKILYHFVQAFCASFGVTVITMPIIGVFFYQVSPYAVGLNIIVVPLMAVIMAGGILGGLLAFASKWLGMLLVGPACYVLRLYMWLCERVSTWPHHIEITGCPSAIRVVLYAFIIVIIYFIAKNVKRSYFNVLAVVCTTAVGILILFAKEKNELAIHMLDVGQGQSILVENSGHFMMVDCGSSDIVNCAERRIIPCLKYYGVKQLDLLAVTHQDSDHNNGVEALTKAIGVRQMVNGGLEANLWAGSFFDWKDSKITIFNPSKNKKYSDENSASLTFLIEKGEFSMLFTGDLDGSEEKYVARELQKYGKITVLQVAHHGSKNSSTREFVEAIRPQVSIISCGINNSYGHPHSQTLSNITAVKSVILRTDLSGEITIMPYEKEKLRQFAFSEK